MGRHGAELTEHTTGSKNGEENTATGSVGTSSPLSSAKSSKDLLNIFSRSSSLLDEALNVLGAEKKLFEEISASFRSYRKEFNPHELIGLLATRIDISRQLMEIYNELFNLNPEKYNKSLNHLNKNIMILSNFAAHENLEEISTDINFRLRIIIDIVDDLKKIIEPALTFSNETHPIFEYFNALSDHIEKIRIMINSEYIGDFLGVRPEKMQLSF